MHWIGVVARLVVGGVWLAAGLLKMRHAGARTVGQNEKTCVVYGMPRVAYELGAVEQQLPLASIGEEILKLTTARKEGAD